MELLTVNSVSLQSLFVRENLWLSSLCDYLKTLSKPKVGAKEFKITMLYIHYAILWFQIFICWVSISVNWQKLRCSQTFDFVVLLLQLSFLVIYLCILSSPGFPKGSFNLYLNKPWSSDPLSFSCRLISKTFFRSVSPTIPSTSS